MSTENISISIDPSPLRTFIKSIVKEEMQPTLYGNDHTLAQLVQGEVEVSPRIRDHIVGIISDYTSKTEFDYTVRDIVSSNIESIVSDNINYEEIAENIDVSDVASYIRMSRLAAEVNISDIVAEISLDGIASELSIRDIASEIDIEDLADTIAEQHMTDISETLAVKIDYKKLAAALLDVIAERSKSAPIL